jgi:pyridoxal phosphate phosphatase PHOSPHO2
MVLVRKQFGLEKRIAKEGASAGLVCKVRYWGGAWEVEEIFEEI